MDISHIAYIITLLSRRSLDGSHIAYIITLLSRRSLDGFHIAYIITLLSQRSLAISCIACSGQALDSFRGSSLHVESYLEG
ncbi:hypothetical protein NHX12_022266 [Muraenolepis orangiensis]|uniref:Uncharacterized protein n=1 Tax=Muraenolepis orangiensis TaxID=630683 RepID=A0A9Q0ET80_9TELE|nr:hypothetical protein NHX12_022266 [Muraenolepis orangiensis]